MKYVKNVLGVLLAFASQTGVSMEATEYAELMVGASRQEVYTDSSSYEYDESDIDAVTGLRIGAPLGSNLFVEIGYLGFGDFENKYFDEFNDLITEKIEIEGVSLGVKWSAPIDESKSFNVRVGAFGWESEYEGTISSSPGMKYKADNDGVDLYYSAGFTFNIGHDKYAAIEYYKLDIDELFKESSMDIDLDNVVFTFGYFF